MILARTTSLATSRPAARPQRSVVVKATGFSFPKLPFGKRDDEEEEEYEAPKPAPFSLSLPFGRSEEAAPKPAKRAAAKPAAKRTSAAKPAAKPKSYVYEGSAGNSLVNNPFSTVEKDRPIGKYRSEVEIDLSKPKPSLWEMWGRRGQDSA